MHVPPLLLGLFALVRGKVRHDEVIAEVQEELAALITPDFFAGAPFAGVQILLEIGTRTHLVPRYGRVRQGYLIVNTELAMKRVWAAQPSPPTPEEVRDVFKLVVLEALVAISRKYGLAGEHLVAARDELRSNWPYRPLIRPDETKEDEPEQFYDDEPRPLELVVQLRVEVGTEAELDLRHRLEAAFDRRLKRARAGSCTGGDMGSVTGSATMNIDCLVTSLGPAVGAVYRALQEHDTLAGAVIAYYDEAKDDYVVVFPPQGVFVL